MAMINYADKVTLNTNSNIADINKCNASDLNEIKNAFNNQVAFGWYQTGLSPTFTYVSWDSSVRTGVVNSNLDLTPYLSVGMKVKFTQNSAIKYAFITAITSTQLTLFLGTDYSLNNSAISNSYYSMFKAPFGFPLNPDKWSVLIKNSSNLSQTNPNPSTYYNLGGLNLSVPIGDWEVSYSVTLGGFKAASITFSADSTLSTTNNSETDKDMTGTTYIEAATATLVLIGNIYKSKSMSFTSKTPLYLLGKANGNGLNFYGNISTTIIKAVSSYL